MTQKTIHKLLKDIHIKLDYIIELLRDETLRYPGHETYLDSMNENKSEFKSNRNK